MGMNGQITVEWTRRIGNEEWTYEENREEQRLTSREWNEMEWARDKSTKGPEQTGVRMTGQTRE